MQQRVYKELLTKSTMTEIACRLKLSSSTVANRAKAVFKKLHARNRVELMAREIVRRKR